MFARSIALAVILSVMTGCGPVLREVRHPGGYPGYLLDKRTFDASRSKQLQLFRAALIMAMAARMGTATIRDGKDADAFVDYLAASADEINYTAANIYPVQPPRVESLPLAGIDLPCAVTNRSNPNSPTSAKQAEQAEQAAVEASAPAIPCAGGYYSLFESDMPMMEARILRLMLAALPEDRVRSFLQDVQKGNILSAGWNAIKAAAETTGGLHRATGVYRSGLELVAANMDVCRPESDVDKRRRETAKEASRAPDFAMTNQEKSTVWNAAECLGLPHDQLVGDSNEAVGANLGATVSRATFHAIMRIARTACVRLQINTDAVPIDKIDQRFLERMERCRVVAFDPRLRPGVIIPPAPAALSGVAVTTGN